MTAEKKSISEKITDLEIATDWFYSDQFKLDEATQRYKEALELAAEINRDLDAMENEVEVLTENFAS